MPSVSEREVCSRETTFSDDTLLALITSSQSQLTFKVTRQLLWKVPMDFLFSVSDRTPPCSPTAAHHVLLCLLKSAHCDSLCDFCEERDS